MRPAQPLHQQINRSDIRYQDVKVDVQGLFKHLSAYHYQPSGTRSVPDSGSGPEQISKLLLITHAVDIHEARVIQQNNIRTKCLTERRSSFLSSGHRIADNPRTATFFEKRGKPLA
jgi:hypothetical protein